MKDNLQLVIIIVAIAGTIGYIWWQQQQLNEARRYRNEKIASEIAEIVKQREAIDREIDSLTIVLEEQELINAQLAQQVRQYKRSSDSYYERWQQYQNLSESDTSTIALLNLLRAIASSDTTIPGN